MFDKFQQLMQLKKMQDSLKKETTTVEKEGVKVVINGNFLVEEIILNPSLDKEKQKILLKECFNEAVKQLQLIMAQKLSGLV